MDAQKIAEAVKSSIIGEIKQELKEFIASVTGELSGFRLAIESMNARMNSLEARQANFEAELRDIRRALDETNKRIDHLRAELKVEIMKNTERIDETNKRIGETNKRIDYLHFEVSGIRGDLNKALSQQQTLGDVITRVQKLEERVLTMT
jgi:chromosome segregation ATPase